MTVIIPTHRVFHLNRLVTAHPIIRAFFAWWDQSGDFPITIPSDGGLRLDPEHQLMLFNQGVSGAKTLEETPHGRGAAADAYPAIVSQTGSRCIGILKDKEDPQVRALFTRYGNLAESRGLEWGGRWKRVDMPHVEVKDWEKVVPYPPMYLPAEPGFAPKGE